VWFARAGKDEVVVESTDGQRWTVAGWRVVEAGVEADRSGRRLAVAVVMPGEEGQREVVLLGAADGAVRWRRPVGDVDPLDLAFAGDGSALAVAQRDGQVRVYDTADGRERFVVRTGTQDANCIALDHAGRELAVGSLDHWIEVRDAATGALRHRLAGHGAAVQCVAYDPASGRLVSGASDRTLRVWDTRTGACVRILRGHTSAAMAVTFEPGGPLHSISTKDLRTWPREDPDVVRSHDGPADGNPTPYVYGVAFSPDGTRFASCGWDGTVRVHDATTRRELACFAAELPVRGVAYSPDGRWLAFAHDRVEVRDARTGALRGRYGTPGPRREQLVFLPDDRRLVVGRWHAVDLIDLESGAVKPWRGGKSQIGRVACSPDGRLIAHEEGKGGVALRRVADGAVIARWRTNARGLRALAFRADGRLLATGGADTVVRLWSVPGGEPRGTLVGHTLQVYALAFSPDGRWLASGSDDHTIRLWDVARGEERLVLTGHGRYVFDLAFSPDGKTLASASGDNTVRFWSTEPLRARADRARRIEQAEAALRTRFADAGVAGLAAPLRDANPFVRRAAANLALEWGVKEAER
jgi:WD40 repeat protein